MRGGVPDREIKGATLSQIDGRTAVALCAVFAILITAYGVMASASDTTISDASADWIVVSAATGGLDPTSDIEKLAAQLGVEFHSSRTIHPRPPGSLWILKPLSWLEFSQAHLAVISINAIALLVLLIIVIPRLVDVPIAALAPYLMVATASGYVLESMEFGTWSATIALACSLYWLWGLGGRSAAGLAVGFAGAFKLFPLGILVPSLVRKPRVAATALLFTIGLTLAGFLTFDISLADQVSGLARASSEWLTYFVNGSLPGFLARLGAPLWLTASIVPLLIAPILLVSQRWPWQRSVALATVLSLLASPLSWIHYDIMLLPIALVFCCKGSVKRMQRYMGHAWLVSGLMAVVMRATGWQEMIGNLSFASRVLLLSAVCLGGSAPWDIGDPQNRRTAMAGAGGVISDGGT